MPFPVLGSNSAVAGYEIDNSLRFNNDDSAYMQYTPSSASSSRTKWTWSGWIKRGHEAVDENNDYHRFFCVDADINNYIITGFNISGAFNVTARNSNTQVLKFETGSGQFRDHSAWYHIVMAYDSTQSTARNRFRVYFNGVEDTRALATTPSENLELTVLNTSEHNIGRDNHSGTTYYYDGYMSEVHFVDGTQYAASDFGEFNDNGVWIPKEADVTYGTNGFKLEFKNSGSLGTDTSGNGNNLTATNLTATDQTTDTPTNNFCTVNPLDSGTVTFAEGNCEITCSDSETDGARGTIGVQNGKWYFEFKLISHAGGDPPQVFGVAQSNAQLSTWVSTGNYAVYEIDSGKKRINGSQSTYGATATDNDIIGVALNMDDNEVTFYKNGSSQGTITSATSSGEFYFPYIIDGTSSRGHTTQVNFGNAPFTISSGNSDSAGLGNFEYAVPSGYYSLCTKNLAEYG